MEKLTKWRWSSLEKQVTNIMDVALWPWKCCVYQCCWNSKDTVLHKHHIVIPVAVRGLLYTWWNGLVFQSWMVKVLYREIHEPTLMSAVRWSEGFWWRLGGVLHLSAEASGIQRENTNKLSGCAFFIMFFCKRDGYVKVLDENSPVVRVLQGDMNCGHSVMYTELMVYHCSHCMKTSIVLLQSDSLWVHSWMQSRMDQKLPYVIFWLRIPQAFLLSTCWNLPFARWCWRRCGLDRNYFDWELLN